MIFCYGCGKEIHESAMTCPACGAVQKGDAGTGLKYQSYAQVPWYRKNWFAILCFFIFMPGLLLILLTGTVYYERKGQLRKYSVIAKIFLILYSLLAIIGFANAITNGNQTTSASMTEALTPASPPTQSPRSGGSTATTAVNERAVTPAEDAPSDTAVPDSVKKLSIAINSVDQKISFGKYITAATHKNGLKTTVEQNGLCRVSCGSDLAVG